MWREELNKAMAPVLAEARALVEQGAVLHPNLRELVLPGVAVDDDRLYLRSLLAVRDGERERFDRSGHEAWVNDVHIDVVGDAVFEDVAEWGSHCVVQGLLLAEEVHRSITPGSPPAAVDYVISADLDEEDGALPSCTFYFYRYRPEEPPMLAEIDTFAQPLLRIRRDR